MKLKILRLIGTILFIGMVLFNAIPIYAISANPTTLQINSVNVFQYVLESGDMAFATDFTVEYASTPTETIATTYNVRLMSGATQLSSVAPFSYYNNGFSEGVVWMYFTAAQVTSLGLTWSGTYTMRFDGNPTASWVGGSVPSASPSPSANFHWQTSTTKAQTSIFATTWVLAEAQILTTKWNSAYYILYQNTTTSGTKLSSTGQTYFSNVIPNLTDIAPNALLTAQLALELLRTPTVATPYATTIANDFQGVFYESATSGTIDTVSLTTGSTAVVGVNTAFTSAMINGQIKGKADGVWYLISAVSDTTHLTLAAPYGASGGSGLGYDLVYSTSTNTTIAPANPLQLQTVADALAVPKAVFGTVVCLAIIVFVMVKGAQRANSYKPLIILVVPLLYVFARIGWMPMPLVIGLGILAVFVIAWVFFWEKTVY